MQEVRLIDANALAESDMAKLIDKYLYNQCNLTVGLAAALMPEIEAEPVRHGRWIEKPPYADETVKGLEFQIVCSRCDEQNSSITFDENSVPIAKTFYRTRYCPNCGARMDATDTNVGGKEGRPIGYWMGRVADAAREAWEAVKDTPEYKAAVEAAAERMRTEEGGEQE